MTVAEMEERKGMTVLPCKAKVSISVFIPCLLLFTVDVLKNNKE